MRSTSVFQRRTQREAHYGSIGGFIFSEYRNRKSLEGENECKRYVELEVRKSGKSRVGRFGSDS